MKIQALKCNNCKEVIFSSHVHDFKTCSCKKVGIDGGRDYIRIMGNKSDYSRLELEAREYLKWGRNFDKDMNRLLKTEYILIKDLDTSHIIAILDGGFVENNKFYKELFKKELKIRNKIVNKQLKTKVKMKNKNNKSTGFRGISTLPSGNYRVRKCVNGQTISIIVSSLRKAKETYKLLIN